MTTRRREMAAADARRERARAETDARTGQMTLPGVG